MAKSVDEFDNYEHLEDYNLDESREKELLEKQNECVFMWTNKAGEPVGVVMCYIVAKGKFWLALTEGRARVPAVRRDPRTCVCVSSAGTDMKTGKAITYKGTTVVHRYDDPAVKDWFFEAFAARMNGEGNAARIKEIAGFLKIPERVVLEFTPTKKIGYDGDKMAAVTPGAKGGFDQMFK